MLLYFSCRMNPPSTSSITNKHDKLYTHLSNFISQAISKRQDHRTTSKTYFSTLYSFPSLLILLLRTNPISSSVQSPYQHHMLLETAKMQINTCLLETRRYIWVIVHHSYLLLGFLSCWVFPSYFLKPFLYSIISAYLFNKEI